MRLRVAVLGGLGAAATALAGVFVLAPGVVRGIEPVAVAVDWLAGVDPTLVVLAGSVVVALYVLVSARTGGTAGTSSGAADPFAAAVDDPPEAVTTDRRRVTAERVDRAVDRAVGRGGRPLQDVRDHLERTAAAAYAERERVGAERARAAVGAGAWTDDETAAAFLADERGPQPGIGARLRLWLVPKRERRRRIERTTGAIERLLDADSGEGP